MFYAKATTLSQWWIYDQNKYSLKSFLLSKFPSKSNPENLSINDILTMTVGYSLFIQSLSGDHLADILSQIKFKKQQQKVVNEWET